MDNINQIYKERDKAVTTMNKVKLENTTIKNRLEEAEKALMFYADKSTWGKSNQNHFNRMPFVDVEFFKTHEYQGVWYNNGEIAGKRAREYFNKYEKESER